MKPGLVLLVIALAPWIALGQDIPGPPSTVPAVSATRNAPTLSSDQIRELIRQVAEKDMENDKKQRDYTYIEREEEHRLDGKGQVKSTETKTNEVMMLYGDQVERLIAKRRLGSRFTAWIAATPFPEIVPSIGRAGGAECKAQLRRADSDKTYG